MVNYEGKRAKAEPFLGSDEKSMSSVSALPGRPTIGTALDELDYQIEQFEGHQERLHQRVAPILHSSYDSSPGFPEEDQMEGFSDLQHALRARAMRLKMINANLAEIIDRVDL